MLYFEYHSDDLGRCIKLNACSATGGHLVKLEPEEEMKNVLPQLGDYTWIDGHDKEIEGRWQ